MTKETRLTRTDKFPVTVLNRYGKFFRYCAVETANEAIKISQAIRIKSKEPTIKLTVTQAEFLDGPERAWTGRPSAKRRVTNPNWFLITDTALVWINAKTYLVGYFDTNGAWVVQPAADAYKDGVHNLIELQYENHKLYRIRDNHVITQVFGEYAVTSDQREMDIPLARRILKQMKTGDSFDRLKELAKVTEFVHFPKRKDPESPWISSSISYLRDPENENPKTFDMVKITITIRHSCPDKKAFLEQNKREIAESLLKELEQTKDYQKFGVPTAFLRLTSLILKKNSTAEFLFELK